MGQSCCLGSVSSSLLPPISCITRWMSHAQKPNSGKLFSFSCGEQYLVKRISNTPCLYFIPLLLSTLQHHLHHAAENDCAPLFVRVWLSSRQQGSKHSFHELSISHEHPCREGTWLAHTGSLPFGLPVLVQHGASPSICHLISGVGCRY